MDNIGNMNGLQIVSIDAEYNWHNKEVINFKYIAPNRRIVNRSVLLYLWSHIYMTVLKCASGIITSNTYMPRNSLRST